jgi:hypothetical protein
MIEKSKADKIKIIFRLVGELLWNPVLGGLHGVFEGDAAGQH